jgi:t-SNARE complex subunit (syntaxin)
MEARIAKLEADMDHVKRSVDKLDSGVSDIKKTVSDIRVDVAKGVGEIKTSIAAITERTRHLPTRWEVFLTLATLLAAVGATVALAIRFIPHAS